MNPGPPGVERADQPSQSSEDSRFTMDPNVIEEDRGVRTNCEFAKDPLEAGEIVLRGMRNNDLYVFSHPEFQQIIRDGNQAAIVSFPRGLTTAVRISRRRFTPFNERDRKFCRPADC
jgi:hypothetical protein